MWDEAFAGRIGLDEQILWQGQPKQGILLRAADIFLIPFSLIWGGFAIFWEVGVITAGAPFFFTLWGIPFVLIGLYLIVGRFFVDALQRWKTHYALSDERVIITSGLLNRSVKSVSLRSLADVSLSQSRGSRGTITLGPTQPLSWMYAGTAWPGAGRHTAPTLELIENAQMVYDQIRAAQRKL